MSKQMREFRGDWQRLAQSSDIGRKVRLFILYNACTFHYLLAKLQMLTEPTRQTCEHPRPSHALLSLPLRT